MIKKLSIKFRKLINYLRRYFGIVIVDVGKLLGSVDYKCYYFIRIFYKVY